MPARKRSAAAEAVAQQQAKSAPPDLGRQREPSQSSSGDDKEKVVGIAIALGAAAAVVALLGGKPSGISGAIQLSGTTACLSPTTPILHFTWTDTGQDPTGYDILRDGSRVISVNSNHGDYGPGPFDAGRAHSYQVSGIKSNLLSNIIHLTTPDCSGSGGGGMLIQDAQIGFV